VRIERYLQAHGFLRVELPPELWEVDTEEEPFVQTVGQLLAVGLGRGIELEELILSASNVTAEPDPDDEDAWLVPGDYVAVSVRGVGDWGAEDIWRAGEGPTRGVLVNAGPAADAAGAVLAYTRNLGAEGSVTVLFPRLESGS
jgi:hypothetical protein